MSNVIRLPIVGVLGSASDSWNDVSKEVGRCLAGLNVHLLTGGGPGVMKAVSKAFVKNRRDGACRVIGVIPCKDSTTRDEPKRGYPNRYVEVPIYTHLWGGTGPDHDMSRNYINVLTPAALIALPGGKGTSGECRLAVKFEKSIRAYLGANGNIPALDPKIDIAEDIQVLENWLRDELESD